MAQRKSRHRGPSGGSQGGTHAGGHGDGHGGGHPGGRGRAGGGRRDRGRHVRPGGGGSPWIYGQHAVAAALANPARRCTRLLATDTATIPVENPPISPEIVGREVIDALLPPGAVHQGLALLADPLPEMDVTDLAALAAERPRILTIALDQVTDPQNVGAVMRSAAAFGAAALIVPERHSPDTTGALAKAASGALEAVPLLRPNNLVRALEALKEAGFWAVGFDMDAPQALPGADLPDRCILVLGAEGRGLRRLTRETCDLMVHVPMTGAVESLNVSASAAVALYEWSRRAPTQDTD